MNSRNVVLVHGIFSNGFIFRWMKRDIEKAGFTCFVPVLKPSDAKYGIIDLAVKLKSLIEESFAHHTKFSIIAFSMGGIIARYFLQELGGINNLNKFITISSPHHGSYMAYLFPGAGTFQLRPGSNFLKKLELKDHVYSGYNVYSFRTPFDLSIIPSVSSIWKTAINKKYYSPAHPLMLLNKKLTGDTIKILNS